MAAGLLGISCLCFVDCSLGVASGSGSSFPLPCVFVQFPLLRTRSAVAWRAANTAVGAMGSSVCVLCVSVLPGSALTWHRDVPAAPQLVQVVGPVTCASSRETAMFVV